MKNSKMPIFLAMSVIYAGFLLYSSIYGFEPGQQMWGNFRDFSLQMLKMMPCIFILIGLFDVWVKKETVERHLGTDSGPLSYLWAVLLAGTTVGGIYVALPVASALYSKGAGTGVILVYVSASAICRIPMTLFEASFLGWEFTMVRFAVSIPLVVLVSVLLGRYLDRKGWVMPDEQE